MNTRPQPHSLHRLVKHAIDSGAAQSVAEAEAMFRGYRLAVEISATAAADPISQAALLTVVALGRRVFLGGVSVAGDLGADLATPLPLGRTLADAVTALGALPDGIAETTPTIVIGGGPADRREGFCIRTAAAGWRGGILPIHSELAPSPGPAMPLAGMLSAALAINEAYLFVNGGMPVAGRRVLGLSLWQPDADLDWLAGDSGEPDLAYLPSKLWLIGLGHLGQAYLWGAWDPAVSLPRGTCHWSCRTSTSSHSQRRALPCSLTSNLSARRRHGSWPRGRSGEVSRHRSTSGYLTQTSADRGPSLELLCAVSTTRMAGVRWTK